MLMLTMACFPLLMPDPKRWALGRMGKQIRRVMDALPATKFTVVATTPLTALSDRLQGTIMLDMTWAPQHESLVYSWHGITATAAGLAA